MPVDSLLDSLSNMLPYGLVAVLGLVIAVLASVVLATGNRVNPGLAVFGAGLTALGGALVAWWGLPSDPAAEGAFNAMQTAVMTRFAAYFGMGAVAVMSLLVLAVAGARKEPRDFKAAGATAAGVVLVVLLTALGGLMGAGAPAFSYMRAAGYAAMGALVVAAMLSGGEPDHPGRPAGAAASITYALTVAVHEAAARGMTYVFLLMGTAGVPATERADKITGYLEATGGEVVWFLLAVVAAQVVGLLGVANAAREKQRQAWAGLIWLVVVPPIVWFGGVPATEAIVAAAAGIP